MRTGFFDSQLEQSKVKTAIVSKYFWTWAKIILSNKSIGKIAYVDLFAGPGRYKDGSPSTPLMVLERAIADEQIRQSIVTVFIDIEPEFVENLKAEISSLPGIELLLNKPRVLQQEVGKPLVDIVGDRQLIPTLLFMDPCGYKGISRDLISAFVRNWGCECLVFFNFNRIRPGLFNDLVNCHMEDLFSSERAIKLRETLPTLNPSNRETQIVEEFAQSMMEIGAEYVLPFRFMNESGSRTKHHLIHITKNIKGYEMMKEIMAGEGTGAAQGVPSFQYNPADEKQPCLQGLFEPIEGLSDDLLRCFSGRKMKMIEVYEKHHVGKPFIKKNYKEALLDLEKRGNIDTDPPVDKRRKISGKPTFGDSVTVSFP